MAPSTANPSNLHRAPRACLRCRTAKVRCVISREPQRCDRCIDNSLECIFTQPKKTRTRMHPYSMSANRSPAAASRERSNRSTREPGPEPVSTGSGSRPQWDPPASTASRATSALPPRLPPSSSLTDHQAPNSGHGRRTLVSADARERITAALSSLKGKRGSPFSFVTSDTTSISVGGDDIRVGQKNSLEKSSARENFAEPSLRLSNLLRPLRGVTGCWGASIENDENDDNDDVPQPPTSATKMPSYLSSMTLGQTINDPVESGILTREASIALVGFFLWELNAKWEYVLDPRFDTHDNVQCRSQVLFATILFCASKFTQFKDGRLISTPDHFLQSRLCSLARNLAVRAFAKGDRTIETMQAFYLLACWKEPDDDISYLHSGYAFRILNDLKLEQHDDDDGYMIRRRRTWLALFRQDRQQSLFFMRRAALGAGDDEGTKFVGDLDAWRNMRHALPLDFISCCNADIRQIQSRMHLQVKKASPAMLPCLVDLLDFELSKWKSTCRTHLREEEAGLGPEDEPSFDLRLLHPGSRHLDTVLELWEQSVRLNISSAIVRRALMASVTPSQASEQPGQQHQPHLSFDLPAVRAALSTDVAGLTSSVEGAFGTLRQLLSFPAEDLRRAPDVVLLLGPNAALYLCLLLCLPCQGIIGPSFQETAITLITNIARHVRRTVQSPQDTAAMHAAYLDSLVELLEPDPSHAMPPNTHRPPTPSSTLGVSSSSYDENSMHIDETAIEAAHVLAGEMSGFGGYTTENNDTGFSVANDLYRNLDVQSLANLLDPDLFLGMPPLVTDENIDL